MERHVDSVLNFSRNGEIAQERIYKEQALREVLMEKNSKGELNFIERRMTARPRPMRGKGREKRGRSCATGDRSR